MDTSAATSSLHLLSEAAAAILETNRRLAAAGSSFDYSSLISEPIQVSSLDSPEGHRNNHSLLRSPHPVKGGKEDRKMKRTKDHVRSLKTDHHNFNQLPSHLFPPHLQHLATNVSSSAASSSSSSSSLSPASVSVAYRKRTLSPHDIQVDDGSDSEANPNLNHLSSSHPLMASLRPDKAFSPSSLLLRPNNEPSPPMSHLHLSPSNSGSKRDRSSSTMSLSYRGTPYDLLYNDFHSRRRSDPASVVIAMMQAQQQHLIPMPPIAPSPPLASLNHHLPLQHHYSSPGGGGSVSNSSTVHQSPKHKLLQRSLSHQEDHPVRLRKPLPAPSPMDDDQPLDFSVRNKRSSDSSTDSRSKRSSSPMEEESMDLSTKGHPIHRPSVICAPSLVRTSHTFSPPIGFPIGPNNNPPNHKSSSSRSHSSSSTSSSTSSTSPHSPTDLKAGVMSFDIKSSQSSLSSTSSSLSTDILMSDRTSKLQLLSSSSSGSEESVSPSVDPVMEHFKRSLGKDFTNLFVPPVITPAPFTAHQSNHPDPSSSSRSSLTSPSPKSRTSPSPTSSSSIGINGSSMAPKKKLLAASTSAPTPSGSTSSSSPISVDDHFAKALGADWLKLKKGDGENID